MDIYQMGGGIFTPQSPQIVKNTLSGTRSEDVSEVVALDTAAFVIDAASRTLAIPLNVAPICEKGGSRIGSFWGASRNQQYKDRVQGLVETNGSATFSVYNATNNLERIFESSGFGRYVARVIDNDGKILYGWIGGISASGSIYTFSVFNSSALSTQNWFQGGSTSFSFAKGAVVEIYKYATSLSFGSSDTFTEEVPYQAPADPQNDGQTEFRLLASLSDGQYAVDYMNAIIYARKANDDNTETISYTTRGESGSATYVYAEDSGHTTADSGIFTLAVRNDSLSALADTDKDYAPFQVNALGALYVEDTFKAGTTVTAINGTVFDDNPTTETSAAIAMGAFKHATINVTVDSTNSPTDFTLSVTVSPDNVTYYALRSAPLMWWEDVGTATAVNQAFILKDVGHPYMKLTGTATGTDATNTFTVTAKVTPFN